MTTAGELREMPVSELFEKLKEIKGDLFKLRFAIASGQGTETAKLKTLKREIARIETVIGEKRREGARVL